MFDFGDHPSMFRILFFLLAAHAYFDFPGQGDYLAAAKNPLNPQGQNGVWGWALYSHSMMHAGAVAFFTHSLILGIAEGITHAIIDYWKCRKAISFSTDQSLHIALKVLWAWCVVAGFS